MKLKESIHRGVLGLALPVFLFVLGACSNPGGAFPIGSYERGQAELEDGRWLDAIADLKLFIRSNPTDDLAATAQFGIAKAHESSGDFEIAAVEYEILRAEYPTSKLVEEAWYREGLCWAARVPGVELEQSVTERALRHFDRMLEAFPVGDFGELARAKRAEMRLQLDRKEFRSAQLYARLGEWKAAKITVEALLRDRPDSELLPQMLELQARAVDEIGAASLEG